MSQYLAIVQVTIMKRNCDLSLLGIADVMFDFIYQQLQVQILYKCKFERQTPVTSVMSAG